VQRSLESGDCLPSALVAYAARLHPSLYACSSMKLPVPAAHTLFICEKITLPFFIMVNFESCPPISIIVSTSGCNVHAAFACAVISSRIQSAPISVPINFRPEPVVAAPLTLMLIPCLDAYTSHASKIDCTASSGFPAVRV